MMPEVGRVIDAVRAWASNGAVSRAAETSNLMDALAALDAKLATAGGPPTREEQDRKWGEVVEGDEILSVKTNRWYEVSRSVTDGKGNIKVNIKGAPKPIIRPVGEMTKIRRGVSGEAVDILEVLWSAQTRPTETPASSEVGPMLTDKVDDDGE
jgi:hypothetical protein